MKPTSFRRTVLLLLILLLAACSASEPEEIRNDPGTGESAIHDESRGDDVSAEGSERAASDPLPVPAVGAKVEVTRIVAEVVESEESTGRSGASGFAAGAPALSDAMSTPMPPAAPGEPEAASEMSLTLNQESRLTAGESDDNANWDDYLLYLRNYSGAAVIRIDVSERHQIWVSDSQGRPVLGARIGITAGGQEVAVLRTHSDGRAYFFPKALPEQADEYAVSVTAGGASDSFSISAGGSQREWFAALEDGSVRPENARLDVLFLIDATGSMADEINQLKENVRAISSQIDALPSRPDVRFGMVTYRDRGDEYVTRLTDFTPDVERFAADLDDVYADGGGDYPEDLNEALSEAVHGPEWRVDGTVSLIFLVADAPPHLDYNQANHYAVEMMAAAERGIKIYPIASSGLDEQGEYIFRQMAQATGGRFIFLTYGSEGPGTTGTETEFEVSDYTVSSLDALVVKIVEEELSFLQ